MAISTRDAAAPSLSIFHAAYRVSSRAAVISASESATQFWMVCFSASNEWWMVRDTARSHSMSNARLDWPNHRMQWWIRPGPNRSWARRKPSPSLPTRFS